MQGKVLKSTVSGKEFHTLMIMPKQKGTSYPRPICSESGWRVVTDAI